MGLICSHKNDSHILIVTLCTSEDISIQGIFILFLGEQLALSNYINNSA